MNNSNWYDNKILANALLILFFPVGLYAIWKSDAFAKWWKITSTVLVVLVMSIGIAADSPKESVKESKKSTQEKDTVIKTINCDYNTVEIRGYKTGSDKALSEVTINECFYKKTIDKTLKMVEIANESRNIVVTYYEENQPGILKFLDIKLDEDTPSKWRASKGHNLYYVEKENSLTFIFGDLKKSKVKGSIKFIE